MVLRLPASSFISSMRDSIELPRCEFGTAELFLLYKSRSAATDRKRAMAHVVSNQRNDGNMKDFILTIWRRRKKNCPGDYVENLMTLR
jgi:hypothetical protein